jgi:cobalt-zinc-cadmium resistance protein CzcA
LLPGLQLAYNLNSFKGTGADDKIYNATPQFHSVMLGVGIPIFSGGQKARIEASKMAENIAENDRINTEFSLNIKATQLRQIYQTNLEIVNRYESSELKNGEINYLEFVMLINQTLALKSNYTDALLKLNESAIELQYLTLNQ